MSVTSHGPPVLYNYIVVCVCVCMWEEGR